MQGRKLWTTLLVAVVTLTLVGAACSSGGDGSGGGSPASGGATATLGIMDFQFEPQTLNVSSGQTTITITNDGAVEHSFTLDDESVDQDVEPGETVTVTVDVSADAPFHCKYHPDQMMGTLTVG